MKKVFFLIVAVLCIHLGGIHPVLAQENQEEEQLDIAAFEAWKKEFRKEAIKAGIQKKTLNTYIPQMQLLPHVVKSDRKQPEFVRTFWEYVDNAVSPVRIQKGKEMLHANYDLLQDVYQIYHVPPHYILAFWGMETNYGKTKGTVPLLSSLATLSFDTRRRAFFTKQLIAYLRLLEQGHIAPANGSWAGAMGHFQFIPTTFEAYAVDADGDGKKDLVGNLYDAAFSAGNYLSVMGWHKGSRWGREVIMTRVLPWEKVYNGKAKTVQDWLQMGLIPANGDMWNEEDLKIPAELLMPMGLNGPLFLTYPNFQIIKRWNNSDLYALGVGLLADRIANQQTKIYASRTDERLTFDDVKGLQQKLTEKGYYAGKIDGKIGKKLKRAIREIQKQNGLNQDGYPTKYFILNLDTY